MPHEEAIQLRAKADAAGVVLKSFESNPMELYRRAERVVTMGGYNTLSELLSTGSMVLVVPRVAPRREQLIRAQRFSALGLVDYLHPEKATPGAIAEWLSTDAHRRSSPRSLLDFNGIQNVRRLAAAMVESNHTI
jgi:predicted glycosyltransferase